MRAAIDSPVVEHRFTERGPPLSLCPRDSAPQIEIYTSRMIASSQVQKCTIFAKVIDIEGLNHGMNPKIAQNVCSAPN
jgi:hypothetical protein